MNTVFPLIEARSQIQTGSLIEAGDLTGNNIEIKLLVYIGPWCVASFVTYYGTFPYVIMTYESSKKNEN